MLTDKGVITMNDTFTFQNLTGHTIKYRTSNGDFVLPKGDSPCRVREVSVRSEVCPTVDVNGNKVLVAIDVVIAEVVDLPEPQDGVIYVASAPVAMLAGRADVVAPDTYRAAVRNEKTNEVEAVTRFRLFTTRFSR